MSKSVVVTARITEDLSADLDRLCAIRDRSRAWIIEKAIEAFVSEDLVLRLSLDAAEAAIDRREYVDNDDILSRYRVRGARRNAA